jgi:flagellar basal-body rod modification protein FlgD
MSAGLLGGVANSSFNAIPQREAKRFGELSSEEFIKILITELTNQDPFQPNDSAAILEQLSSLRNIESQTSLQDKLEDLVLSNSIAQAGGMIGKVVEGLDLSNNNVSGQVTAVRIVDGKAILELDTGVPLPLDRVTGISEASPA